MLSSIEGGEPGCGEGAGEWPTSGRRRMTGASGDEDEDAWGVGSPCGELRLASLPASLPADDALFSFVLLALAAALALAASLSGASALITS